MSDVDLPDLTQIDPDLVQTTQIELTERLQEVAPTIDLRRGVLHDLLAVLGAGLAAGWQQTIANYYDARSPAAITESGAAANSGVVDDVLSLWGVTRNPGGTAEGSVTIVITSAVSVTIGAGMIFTAGNDGGVTFTSDQSFTAKLEASQLTDPSDVLLTPTGDNQWSFTITVTATAAGAGSMVTRGTVLIPSVLPTAYLSSFATSDFTGGLDAETNQQILDRIQQGIASSGPSNRTTMNAWLRAQSQFNAFLLTSIVGAGDVEMLRDKHSIVPIGNGGRVDWYIRTQPTVQSLTLTKTATLLSVDPTTGYGVWQVSIARDDAPGFYDIVSILPAANTNFAGSLPIIQDFRGIDLSGETYVPDIINPEEGAYTRFQTSVVQFTDTTYSQIDAEIGSTASYLMAVRVMPLIGEIQDFVSADANRLAGADLLVKAPIPCFVALTFTVFKQTGQAAPDTAAIAAACAAAVNTGGFTGTLYASNIQDAIYGNLSSGMSVSAIDIFGQIRRPNGTLLYGRGHEALRIPTEDGTMVSDKTVQFFLDPTDVAVTVVSSIPTN